MKNEKLTEATMLALRGKLNEWEEAYEDDYGKGITTRWYEVETDDGFLDTHFEDENEAIKVARTYKGDVFVYVTGSEKYTTGDYRGYSEPLDSVLLWQRVNGEEKKFGNSNAILEGRVPYENDDTKPITFETEIDLNNYTNIDKYIIGKIIDYIRQDNTIDKNVSIEQVDKIIAFVFRNGGSDILAQYDDIIYKGMKNILNI